MYQEKCFNCGNEVFMRIGSTAIPRKGEKVAVPAGQMCTRCGSMVTLTRRHQLSAPIGQSAEKLLGNLLRSIGEKQASPRARRGQTIKTDSSK